MINDDTNLGESQEALEDEETAAPEDRSGASNLEEENQALKDQLLRALAEAENIRKRSEREKEETAKFAITQFARDLLNVSDTFARALAMLPESADETIKVFADGIRMTEKELATIFERYGILRIDPLNQPFDHNFHQAMLETETEDAAPGTVLQVLQTGYQLQGRLLRPALVVVAKAKE